MTYSDDSLRHLLSRTRIIALVGYSPKPERASNRVAHYLAEHGYRVIPVNPGLAGQDFMGETIVASLADIPQDTQVDMLDVFRRSEAAADVVADGLAHLPALRTVWLQIGVKSDTAREMTEAKGLDFVQDTCPKMVHERLLA